MQITEAEFKRMNNSDKLLVLFQNTNSVRQEVARLRWHQKLQYVSIGILTTLAVYVLKLIVEHISAASKVVT